MSQAETELDQVLLSKDEREVELEASLTARGAPTVSDIFSLKNVQFYKKNYFTIGVIVGYQGWF